jgi:hypothetical protein
MRYNALMSTYILVFLTVLGASWTLYHFLLLSLLHTQIRICYLCRLMLYRLTDSGQYVSYDLISTDSEILQHPSRQGGRDYSDSSNSFFLWVPLSPPRAALNQFPSITLNSLMIIKILFRYSCVIILPSQQPTEL